MAASGASGSFLSRAPQPESDSAHGFDKEIVEAPVELMAQIPDERIDDVGLFIRPDAPDVAQDRGALNDFVAVMEEKLEQGELTPG